MAKDLPRNYAAGLDVLTTNDDLMREVARHWNLSWPPRSEAGRKMLALLVAYTVLLALTLGVLGAPHIVLPLLTIGVATKDAWRGSLKWSENASKKIQTMNEEGQANGS